MKILNGIEVDGPMKGTVQASAAGDVPILNSDAELPGSIIPDTTVEFTVPATAWTGTGPYTAEVTVADVAGIATPIIGPNAPDGNTREALADARITALSVNASGKVTLVADGDKPSILLSCIATGIKGAQTGHVVSTFGAGGGGVDFFLNVTVTASAGAPDLSGINITATPGTGTAITATTNGAGTATLGVKQGMTYTVALSKADFTITPASSVVTIQDTSTTLSATCYEAPKLTVSVTTNAVKSGRTITATATGMSPVTGTTDASGSCTLSLPAATWTIACDTPAGYFAPASQSQTTVAGQTYTKTFALDKKPVLTVTVTPMAVASGLLVRAVGDTTVTAYTNASGVATLELVEDEYLVSVVAPAGYLTPASQSLTAVRNVDSSKSFALQTKPIVAVTVVDSSSSGYQVGRTITATNGTDTVTGTTNASGVVNLTLNGTGAYTISTNLPSGATANTVNITATAGGTHSAAITLTFDWTAGMTFNSTTIQTDSTGCLTYADTLASMTPVSNTNTTLGTVSTIGSWGLGDNPTTAGCEYAVFLDGAYYKQLNPANLKQYADGTNATSDVTNTNGRYNVMFVIPLRYTNGTGTKLTHSSISSNGTAYAHTYGGSTYNRLAIPVYPGYVANNKLVSISGVEPTRSQTRATFRTQAQANGTGWHLMNYYEWKLLKEMIFFAMKSFDGQRKIGQGVSSGSTYGPTTGQCDAMGPFAGDVSGTTSQVKAYVEQFWGGSYQFLDDVITNTDGFWVGQNSNPDDTTTGKTNIGKPAGNGFTNAILTGATTWGMGTNASGSDSTGLCDQQTYAYNSTIRLAYVGGDADTGSGAGPSCSYLYTLTRSYTNLGARAAFVYNA